jgi:hypothetical protein
MPSTSWQDRLDAAFTAEDVVEVARNYLSTLEHWEMSLMPERCRPGRMVDGSDLAAYAFTLAKERSSVDPAISTVIDRLSLFFANAATRLARILSVAPNLR